MLSLLPLAVVSWIACAGVVALLPEDFSNPSPQVQKALRDFQSGQHSSAVEAFKAQAEAGDANAQYAYGVCLELGLGVARDFPRAEKFFRQAATKNHRAAQTALGMMLTMAGLPAEVHTQGVSWLQKAADAGDLKAARQLGDFYVTRFQTDPKTRAAEMKKARELFEKGAQRGDSEAKYRLGLMIEEGVTGEKPDVERGVKLIEEAAKEGSVEAMVSLGRQYQSGVQVKQDLEKARAYYEDAVKAGRHREAQFSLGKLYEEGLGVTKDPDRAVFYYRQAAEQKHPDSLVQLGICYDNGLGVERDEKLAVGYFEQAAAVGSGLGMFNVAVCHDLGKGGLKTDPAEAAKWMIKAADADYPLAMNELGMRYKDGQGVLKDTTAAVAWFDKAVTVHRFPAAQLNLGTMFELGVAVPQSYDRAMELYTLAAMAGRPDAKHMLARLFLNGLGAPRDSAKAYVLLSEAAIEGYQPAIETKERLEKDLKPEELAKAREMLDKIKAGGEKIVESRPPESSLDASPPDPETRKKEKKGEKPATVRKVR
ncbi:MAG: SEL1-like repeat protein [Verrucomicrobiales bacterium]